MPVKRLQDLANDYPDCRITVRKVTVETTCRALEEGANSDGSSSGTHLLDAAGLGRQQQQQQGPLPSGGLPERLQQQGYGQPTAQQAANINTALYAGHQGSKAAMRQLGQGVISMYQQGQHGMHGNLTLTEAGVDGLKSDKEVMLLKNGLWSKDGGCVATTDDENRAHAKRNCNLPRPYTGLASLAMVPATCEFVCFMGWIEFVWRVADASVGVPCVHATMGSVAAKVCGSMAAV